MWIMKKPMALAYPCFCSLKKSPLLRVIINENPLEGLRDYFNIAGNRRLGSDEFSSDLRLAEASFLEGINPAASRLGRRSHFIIKFKTHCKPAFLIICFSMRT